MRDGRCARSGLGPGAGNLGSDPNSAAEPRRPRLYNGDTAAVTDVARQDPPGLQDTTSCDTPPAANHPPSESLRPPACASRVRGAWASSRPAQHAASQGLSAPAFRAECEPETEAGTRVRGAARPSEFCTCPRTAGAPEGCRAGEVPGQGGELRGPAGQMTAGTSPRPGCQVARGGGRGTAALGACLARVTAGGLGSGSRFGHPTPTLRVPEIGTTPWRLSQPGFPSHSFPSAL